MPKYPKLLAYAQLLRLPNVFTAFADIGLAGAASGAVTAYPAAFAFVLLASGCLYLSGMVWNDFYDRAEDAKARPFRPIPSGRVSARSAVVFGVVLGAAGVGFAAAAGGWRLPGPLALAMTLTVAIHLYNAWLKHTPLGPVAMASCRFLNVLLGLSAAGADVWTWPNVHLAAVVGVYIVGVTWFARTEEAASNRAQLRLAAGVMLLAGTLGILVPVHLPGGSSPWFFPYLLVGFGFLVGVPVARAIARPDPKRVQAAVKRCILGLVVLDAVLATAFVGLPGLLILVLLLPALLLGRWVYST